MTNMHNEPFDDLRSGDLNGNKPDEMLDDELLSEIDLADAERFAEVLDLLEAGGGVDLDPREDPTLAALTTVAAQLHDNAREATSTRRFASYRARSRDYLLHRIAREREALAASARPEPQRKQHAGLGGIPFLRWNVLSPIASAAAAAVAVLAFVAFTASDTPAPTPVEPVQAAVVDTPAVAPVADDADKKDAVEPVTPQPDPVRAATVPSSGPSAEDVLDQFAAATSVRYAVIADDARAALAAAMDAAASADAADDTPAAEAAPPPVTVAVAPAPVAVAPRPVPVAAATGEPFAASTQRATPRTVPGQLDYIDTLLGELTVKVERQQPVPAQLLRELTESIAAVAYGIESDPDGVTHAQVVAYIHAAADGRFLLATAVAEEADEAALNAARRVAQDGVVVAGWYFKYR